MVNAMRRGETLKESSKEKDVRISNIVAAKGECFVRIGTEENVDRGVTQIRVVDR